MTQRPVRRWTRAAAGTVLLACGLGSTQRIEDDATASLVRTPLSSAEPFQLSPWQCDDARGASQENAALPDRPSVDAPWRLIATDIPQAARRYIRCWNAAARRFQIDPLLLVAIGTVESRLRPDTVHVNHDGSRDLGLMQINTVHLPRLERQGVSESRLVDDPCVSIMTGAEILAQNIRRHGYTWEAVGAYNAGSRADRHALRTRYAQRVKRVYRQLAAGSTMAHALDASGSCATSAHAIVARPV